MQAIPVARTWRPYLWLVAGVLFLLMGACPIYFLVATDAPGAKWLIVVNIGVLLYLAIKAFALVYTRLTIFTDEGMWVPGLRGRQLVRWSEIGRVRKTWRTLVLYAGKRTTGVALEDFRDPEAVLAELRRRLPVADQF